MPAASKAQERSSTIQSMVKLISYDHLNKLENIRSIIQVCFVVFWIISGIILVHDLTNKKSSQNLYRWSLEALNKDSSPTGVIVSNG